MPRQKPADKLEALRRQQSEIAAQVKAAEADAKATAREETQRREMLAGRFMLAQLQQDPDGTWSKATLALLDGALKRPADRALFPALADKTGSDMAPASEAAGTADTRKSA